MKKLFLLAWLLCASILSGATVNILDTLTLPDASLFNGDLVITNPTFTSAEGVTIVQASITVAVDSGALDIDLEANTGATPSGTSYAVRYLGDDGTNWVEFWVVPATGPVEVNAIRVASVPTPSILLLLTQLDQGGAATGEALVWNGSEWEPAAGGTGITTLNGESGSTQTFADVDDTNVTLTISSASDVHTFTLGWTGLLALARGGTGADLSATGGANQFLKQSSAGAVVTVGTIADADVPNTISLTSIAQAADVDLTGLSDGECLVYDGVTDNRFEPGTCGSGGGGAPTDAQYWTAAANGTLSAEVVVNNEATLESAVGSINLIVATEIDTVAELAGILTNEDFTPGSESGAEGVLDLQDLQGAVTDGQVPDTVTLTSVAQAGDVDLTGVADGNCLVYDGVTDNRFEPGSCGSGAVSSVSGTSNEISVSPTTGDVVVALADSVDLSAHSQFRVPGSASPVVDTFGEIGCDTNWYGAGRGACFTYDGTAGVYFVAILGSDTPTNGQVPKWNTGGTVTWEEDSSSSGGIDSVEEDNSEVVASAVTVDFGTGFDVADAGAGEADISIDAAELETAFETVLDLQDLQGAVTDGQVPDTVTLTSVAQAGDVDLTSIADGNCLVWDGVTDNRFEPGSCGAGGGAPTDAQYWTAAADGTLSAEVVVTNEASLESAVGSINLIVSTEIDTVAELAGILGNEDFTPGSETSAESVLDLADLQSDPTTGAIFSAAAGDGGADTNGGAFDWEEGATDPGNPSAGWQRAYIRTSDSALVLKNSGGTITEFAYLEDIDTVAELAGVLGDEDFSPGSESSAEGVLDLEDLQGTLGTGQADGAFILVTEIDTVAEVAAILTDEDFSPGSESSAEGVLELEDLQGPLTGANHRISLRFHATDCTGLTDGVEGEVCWEQDQNRFFICEPSAGVCDTAGEWTQDTDDTGAGGGVDSIEEDNSEVVASAQTIDFANGFDVADGGSGEAEVTIDAAELEAAFEAVLDLEDLQGTLGTGQADGAFILSTEIDTVAELAGVLGDEDFTPGSEASAEGALDHDDLQGFVSNEHVDHSGVSISGGLGLAGGGDITASRSLTIDYSQTLAGNPALNAKECLLVTEGTSGGGLLCEGTAANTNEQLYLFPALDGADTTTFFALGASDGDALAGDSATAFFDGGTIEHERGGLEADVSGYTNGLYGQLSGATADVDTEGELETALGGINAIVSTEIDTVAELAGVLGDEDFTPGSEASAEGVLDLPDLQGQISDSQIADGAVDGGTGGEIADGSIAVEDVEAILKTRQVHFKYWGTGTSFVLEDSDDELSVFNNQLGQGITISEVVCEADTGTPTFQLQRDDGTPTNMLDSNLTCATTPASTTSFVSGENAISDGDRLDALIVAAGGSAHWIAVTIVYTLD